MKVQTPCGISICDMCEDAVKQARLSGSPVEFEFNELPMIARPESYPRDLSKIYMLAHELRYVKNHTGHKGFER